MRDIAFLGFFLACLPAVLRYPHIGAMLWIWLALASPDEYLFGFMTVIPLSKLVAGMTIAAVVFSKTGRRFYLDPILGLMILLALCGAISASVSLTPQSLNWDIYGKLLKILALCAVMSAVTIDRVRLHGLLVASVVALALSGAAEGLKMLLSGGGHKVLGLMAFGDNNAFALAMAMSLPLFMVLIQTSRARLARVGFTIIMGLTIVAIIGTYSRGGFIALVTVAIGLILLNRNKLRNLVLVALAGLVLLQAAPASWFARINTLHTATHDDSSFTERVTAWKISTLVALDRPLTGGGFHAIQDTNVWNRYARDLPELDFIPSAPPDEYGRAAHSIYFEVLGDLGFTGLLVMAALVAAGFSTCGRTVRRARGHPDLAWAADLARMMRLSLVVFLVAGAALSMAYFELVYILLALISITYRLVAREVARRQPERAASAMVLGPDNFYPVASSDGIGFAVGSGRSTAVAPPTA